MGYYLRDIIVVFSCVVILFVQAKIEITKVERTIDLTSQLAKVNSQITLHNKGQSDITSFNVAIEEDQFKFLSFLEVTVS